MVFNYASTTVRSNAVCAVHQLVKCVANPDPVKTLAKFSPHCSRDIRTELDNGASSLRTIPSPTPRPSDATLHWSEFCLIPYHTLRSSLYLDFAILRRGGLQVSFLFCSQSEILKCLKSAVMDER